MEHVFKFPAARGIQAGREYFMVVAPFGVLRRLLAIDNTARVLDRSQRDVDMGRAKKLAAYIKQNPGSWVIPSLVGNIESAPDFEEHVPGTMVGTLSLPMDAVIKLLDGQHRAMGIMSAIGEDDDLRHSSVPLQLYVKMDLAARQQAFTDINLNAKTVSKGLSMVYDHRDEVAQAIADAVGKVRPWVNRIEWQKASCSGDNPNMFPFKAAVEAFHIYMGTSKKVAPNAEQIAAAVAFFNLVGEAASWKPYIISPDMNMRDQRDSWITYHVVGLKALALWGQKARDAGVDMEEACERLYQHRNDLSRNMVHKWEGKCMGYDENMRCNKDAIIDTAKELCKMTEVSAPEHHSWL